MLRERVEAKMVEARVAARGSAMISMREEAAWALVALVLEDLLKESKEE